MSICSSKKVHFVYLFFIWGGLSVITGFHVPMLSAFKSLFFKVAVIEASVMLRTSILSTLADMNKTLIEDLPHMLVIQRIVNDFAIFPATNQLCLF